MFSLIDLAHPVQMALLSVYLAKGRFYSSNVSPIYYHNTDNSRLELDFVIQRNATKIDIPANIRIILINQF